jgi:hypothetical protein
MKHIGSWLFLLALAGCGTEQSKQPAQLPKAPTAARRPTAPLPPDTLELLASYQQDDLPPNDYLSEQLKPIQANFRALNSRSHWDKVVRRDLYQSAEGGEARYYYAQNQLRKIVARHYGEMFQQLTEYYLLPDGELSFVFERDYRYNRPMYYDAAAAKANGDTEAFDLSKAGIEETRNYFERGRLIHQLDVQDYGKPKDQTQLQLEQKRLVDDFTALLQTLKSPD